MMTVLKNAARELGYVLRQPSVSRYVDAADIGIAPRC